MMLYKRYFVDLPKQKEMADNPFGGGVTDTFLEEVSSETVLHDYLTGKNLSDQVLRVCYDHLKNIAANWNSYFKSEDQYNQASRDGIAAHLESRIRSFMNIHDATKPEPDDEVEKVVGMPPHIYLTATPIDYQFNINGHDPEDNTRFAGESQDPENRICFGTLQLASDILLKENMDLTDEYADTGMLLNYFYGNR